MIKTNFIVSRSISSIGYDENEEILEITFKPSGTYHYFNVEKSIYKQLMDADSKGGFVNKVIKDNYDYVKIS